MHFKTIGIRADANDKIAMGHLMRCLSIAVQLKNIGGNVLFIVSDECAADVATARGFECICLKNRYDEKEKELPALSEIISEKNIAALLLDSYEVTEKYMSKLREKTTLIYIDDLKKFCYPADVLVDYVVGAGADDYPDPGYKKYGTIFLLGKDYIPLGPGFAKGPIAIRKNVERILITTGGADECDMIFGLLDAMRGRAGFENIEKCVVAGRFYDKYESLCERAASEKNITPYHDVSDMCSLMRRCDMAISAGGTTLAELAACGLPTICFSVSDDQMPGTSSYDKRGIAVYAGDVRAERDPVIARILDEAELFMEDEGKRAEFSARAKAMIDGCGARRIAEEIMGKIEI